MKSVDIKPWQFRTPWAPGNFVAQKRAMEDEICELRRALEDAESGQDAKSPSPEDLYREKVAQLKKEQQYDSMLRYAHERLQAGK